jgi:signal transduction histidine kinase
LSALSPAPRETLPSRRRERGLAAVESAGPDFELLFRSAPTLLVVLEPSAEFRIVAASDAYLRARRATWDGTIGKPFFDAFPETEESPRVTGAASLRAALERVVASGKPDALNTPVRGAGGKLRYIIHRVDAIELELLRSAHERDEALARAKAAAEDLEAFAQCLSNEVRAPLRAIDESCRQFAATQETLVRGEVGRLLTRIGTKVNRMDTIIDGLLGLSRAARVHMARKRVDLSELSRRVVAGLEAREPERMVTIAIEEGLEAWADENLVRIVLENVIGNAWKYTRRTAGARIEVGGRNVGGQTVFHVRDNGVGFDMAHAGRLFAPFVRLHETPDFEGYGIGLTSAKRIVERHGGEIWAEGRVGEGATLHFTLGAGLPR